MISGSGRPSAYAFLLAYCDAKASSEANFVA
jgi:hypothetical protein